MSVTHNVLYTVGAGERYAGMHGVLLLLTFLPNRCNGNLFVKIENKVVNVSLFCFYCFKVS